MFEYKVIPAPDRADRVKGMKRPEDRFAHRVECVLNDMAAAGWSFLRTESLPAEERRLLRSEQRTHTLLVFYREAGDEAGQHPAPVADPGHEAPSLQAAPSLGAASRHDAGPASRPEPPAPAPAPPHEENRG